MGIYDSGPSQLEMAISEAMARFVKSLSFKLETRCKGHMSATEEWVVIFANKEQTVRLNEFMISYHE